MTEMVPRAEPGTTSDMLSDRCRDTGSRMVLRRSEARGLIEGAQDKQRNKDGELKSHDRKGMQHSMMGRLLCGAKEGDWEDY